MQPENNRITVKLPASIWLSPRANRQKTELAAKANNANVVNTKVLLNITGLFP